MTPSIPSAEGTHLATESVAGRRPYQEDAVETRSLGDGRTVVAVADGMGGHAAGEVASSVALEALLESLDGGASLESAVELANERVHAVAQDPEKKGMGTTLVVLLFDGDRYWVANVGDSRAYLVSDQGIEQLTRDHSFVAEAVAGGTSEEEAMRSPWKDALTRSIGTEPSVEVDVFGPHDVRSDSALLLCSDGLYKVLPDRELERIFRGSTSTEGAARALVSTALEEGSDDNITVAIAEFGRVSRKDPGGTQELEWDPPDAPDPAETRDRSGVSGRSDTAGASDARSPEQARAAPVGRGARLWVPGALILLALVLLVGLLIWI